MPQSEYRKMFEAETGYFWFVAKQELVVRLAGRLALSAEAQILDLGCGTGINMRNLQQFGFAVGLDFYPEAFSYCRKRSLGELVLSRGEILPFPDQSFDLVTSLDTVEHSEDAERMVKEVFRALKPGGYFMMTAPAYPRLYGAHDQALGHKLRFTKKGMRELLRGAGFRVLLLGNYFGMVFPVALALKLIQKKFGNKSQTISYRLPFPVNQTLLAACRIENRLFPFWQLPFGTTLVALCRK